MFTRMCRRSAWRRCNCWCLCRRSAWRRCNCWCSHGHLDISVTSLHWSSAFQSRSNQQPMLYFARHWAGQGLVDTMFLVLTVLSLQTYQSKSVSHYSFTSTKDVMMISRVLWHVFIFFCDEPMNSFSFVLNACHCDLSWLAVFSGIAIIRMGLCAYICGKSFLLVWQLRYIYVSQWAQNEQNPHQVCEVIIIQCDVGMCDVCCVTSTWAAAVPSTSV